MEKSDSRDHSVIPVIFPTYKAPEKLSKCLEAIKSQTYSETEVFVRDNSENGVLYTKAINEGLRKYLYGPGKPPTYVLLLTDDCFMERNCLERLLAHMLKTPDCGIACPIQRNKDGQVTWGGSAAAWPGGIHIHLQTPNPFETYWANGACMLVRVDMIREIGLMDENMRFLCSDSDYSFTARSRGWKVMVVPDASAEHTLDLSGSWGRVPWLDQVKLDDLIYFTKKWLSGDLYKKLSFEGGLLTHTIVRSQINQWLNQKRRISGSESRALSSELRLLLSP